MMVNLVSTHLLCCGVNSKFYLPTLEVVVNHLRLMLTIDCAHFPNGVAPRKKLKCNMKFPIEGFKQKLKAKFCPIEDVSLYLLHK